MTRELVYAEAAEQPRVFFENADHFVDPAVQPHLFPDRVRVRKQ